MLSGNGRHRRPRQAPALIVAAGVTGSAIAIPLLGATGASAATGTTWDRVAECESGGSWSANNGNGYYGGLQISQDDWVKYGGVDYAESPDVASRSQQIAVAERILDAEGVDAWPTCGLLAGLDGDSAPAGVDTGLAADAASGLTATPGASGTPESGLSDSSQSSGSSASTGAAEGAGAPGTSETSDSAGNALGSRPSGSVDASPSPDSASGVAGGSAAGEGGTAGGADNSPTATTKNDDSDKLGQNASGSIGAGRHRGDSAEEEAEDSRAADPSGRHASRDSGAARDAADGTYTVRAGDSLWGIADSLEVRGGWAALYAENKATVGTDPDLILPGQTLEVGVEPGEK
ncbi:transglycosylase family protein [Streptomyces sp.]|uniref:transglycosylase family protein n=1 Tax=Streptomyces sp. TaxID=1931 RepID=UPI002BA27298|nr:transglycosylase family protein [Streptomyces sp.]HLL32460.1 transglycosylase family protein [Streptomyces sp.]HZF91968.1 transglycosylase family protein [Streptomyces sp.]